MAAPPVDGAANHALVRLIADSLAVPPSSVRIVAGDRSRRKRVQVVGVSAESLRARWPGLAL